MTWLWIAVGLIVAFNVLLLLVLAVLSRRRGEARDLTPQQRMTEDELYEAMQDMWRPTRAL